MVEGKEHRVERMFCCQQPRIAKQGQFAQVNDRPEQVQEALRTPLPPPCTPSPTLTTLNPFPTPLPPFPAPNAPPASQAPAPCPFLVLIS